MEDYKFFTVDECAKLLGVTKQTIRKYINTGELAAYHFGHAQRINKEALDAFLESRKIKKSK